MWVKGIRRLQLSTSSPTGTRSPNLRELAKLNICRHRVVTLGVAAVDLAIEKRADIFARVERPHRGYRVQFWKDRAGGDDERHPHVNCIVGDKETY
jgi:hypothetical protein